MDSYAPVNARVVSVRRRFVKTLIELNNLNNVESLQQDLPARASTKDELRRSKPSRHDFLNMTRSPLIILLDNLRSGHNVGSIFRTADAIRAEKLILCGSTLTPPLNKITRASKGSEKWVPWEYASNSVDAVENLKSSGVMIISAELSETSLDYRSVLPVLPCCLVLGNERKGVSTEVLSRSDYIVHIPMLGMQNSINVSVVAGILSLHLQTQIVQNNISL
jgi:tRNA G18 (ribose-2'-O)-methylase SpoU